MIAILVGWAKAHAMPCRFCGIMRLHAGRIAGCDRTAAEPAGGQAGESAARAILDFALTESEIDV